MIYFLLFSLSFIGTYTIRWYANKKAILDIPNERSSHTIPTPMGGGLAMMIGFFIGLLYFHEQIEDKLFYALLWVLPIMIISFIDDIFSLSFSVRAMVQSISILCALYVLGGVDTIDFKIFQLEGYWVNVLVFLAMFWITNLYNFLDGIDGYAGSQTITMGLGLFLFFGNPLGLVLVAVSLGFLIFNWHKASIFMGDVGATSLGFVFSVFIFYDTSLGNIYIWIVLLSLFWFDATVTLFRRFFAKERLSQAHKKHAYQRLVQAGYSHSQVVSFALLFNICFLAAFYFLHALLWVPFVNLLLLILIFFWVESKKPF